jgi:AhpD family alkylhydroperoxidase
MIRYITPVRKPASGSTVAAVYAQIRREFGIMGEPLILHSPLPDLLAGVWCSFREAILAGTTPRRVKEAVAVAVSRVNSCPYCVDAHSIMLRAASSDAAPAIQHGDTGRIADPQIRAAVEWASAPGHPEPFGPEAAPEMIGTAVWIHYINRMVSVFLSETLLWFRSDPAGLRTLSERAGAWFFAPLVRRPLPSGASLDLVPRLPLPPDMSWAAGSPAVSQAFAAFAGAVDRHGSRILSQEARSCIASIIDSGDTERARTFSSAGEPAGIPVEDRAAVRLALTVAIAPHRVPESEVEEFRALHPSPEDLLALLAWSSFAAARRAGRSLSGSAQS